MTDQLYGTVITGLAKYLNIASEEVRKRFPDLFRILCWSDLGFRYN
ncbi:MAG TPA: hypothetical protein VFV92_12155 [Candidatus Bathyarchaeia archaeon]|nr:hypothetical protein [Candidatus Bathyarchaeia archaeon]